MAIQNDYENLMCLASELKATMRHSARMITTAILMGTGKWAATEAVDMAEHIEKETRGNDTDS